MKYPSADPSSWLGRLDEGRSTKWLLVLFLVVSAAVFLRGSMRAISNMESSDWRSPYVGARSWLKGDNPYLPAMYEREAASSGISGKQAGMILRLQYPPPSIVALVPLCILPWKIDCYALTIALTVAVPLAAWWLAVALRWPPSRVAFFVGLAMLFGPFRAGIEVLNPSAVAAVLLICASAAFIQGRQIPAGVLLGCAASMKPTVGIFFLVACVLSRRWTVAGIAGGIVLVATAIGIGRLQLAGVDWVSAYRENARIFFAPGGISDCSNANRARYNMVQMQVLIFSILHSVKLAQVVGYLGYLSIAAFGVLKLRRLSLETGKQDELLALSVTAILSLLPVYHRYYDVGIMLLPVAWCVHHFNRASVRRLVLPLSVLFVPGTLYLYLMQDRLPPAFTASLVWQALIMPHQVIILLGLAVALPLAASGSANGNQAILNGDRTRS